MDIENLSITSLRDGLAQKKFSATEIAGQFFDRIAGADEKIGAYLRLTKDLAFSQASRIDDLVARGAELPPLAGVPVGLKDIILVEGESVSAGSKILSRYRGGYDATVTRRLKEAGAVILGYTNMDEFAMGSSTENSSYQLTRNPHDPERVPGGSSGGSAAAVAAGMALGALGSDTGGSIRQPAAFCGVVGFKPTYGAVSRFGLMAMASSLDQIGPFSRTVQDAAQLFVSIAGHDPLDATSAALDYDEALRPPAERIRSLTVGLPKEYFVEGLDQTVRRGVEEAVRRFTDSGFKVKEVSLPHTKYALACYYIIMPAEVSTNLARFDGIRYSSIIGDGESETLRDEYFKNRGRGFGREARRRILLGTFVLSAGYYDAYYAQAQKVRRLMADDFTAAFKDVDILLAPTTPSLPFRFGDKTDDPVQMYLSDVFTIPANLAGLPALSIPVKKYEVGGGELPVGFQLIGPRFRDADVLGLGKVYEEL